MGNYPDDVREYLTKCCGEDRCICNDDKVQCLFCEEYFDEENGEFCEECSHCVECCICDVVEFNEED